MPQPIQLGALSTEKTTQYAPIRIRHQDKAAYGVGGQGFFDNKCKFWQVGSALYFDGVPNKDLQPLNKLAHERKQAWQSEIDDLGEKMAKKSGKLYVRTEPVEWVEGDDHDKIDMPENIYGAPIVGSNEAIR